MDNLKAIAEKLDLQVEDLLHHWEHHMPKYLTFRGRVIKGTAAGHPFTEWVREGDSPCVRIDDASGGRPWGGPQGAARGRGDWRWASTH